MAEPKDARFDPYALRAPVAGAKEHALTHSTHLQRDLASKGESDAEVYDWHITKLPEDKVMNMQQVRGVVTSLYADAQHSFSLEERATWDVDAHRRVLVDENPAYDAFTQTHPRLFLAITESGVSVDKLGHIMNMISMKADHKRYNVPLEQQQKEISVYFKHNFTHAAEEGEKEEAIASGRGYEASMVKLPAPDEYQKK